MTVARRTRRMPVIMMTVQAPRETGDGDIDVVQTVSEWIAVCKTKKAPVCVCV